MKAQQLIGKLTRICLLVTVVASSNIGNDRQDIALSEDGGYMNILVAIDEDVPENEEIIVKLKEYFTNASEVLFTATHQRLYFKSLTIVVPETWASNSDWEEAMSGETIDRARVVVAEANVAYGDEPYTLQPGRCQEEGDYIHFTPEYLTAKSRDDKKYRPEKRVVKEFAKLKWGLFDENIPVNDIVSSHFYLQNGVIRVQGHCPFNHQGQLSYRAVFRGRFGGWLIDLTEDYTSDRPSLIDGWLRPFSKVYWCVNEMEFTFKDFTNCAFNVMPPPPPCEPSVHDIAGTASLLAYEYLDKVVDFCDQDGDGTAHNILSTNLQNKNCDDLSAWEVMTDLQDFDVAYGQNRPSNFKPVIEFRVVQKVNESNISDDKCDQDVVCICLDVSGSMETNDRITVMSEAVQLYLLSFLPTGSAVSIVSFSDAATVHAEMTEITSSFSREQLMKKVPTLALGRTNIAAGVRKCHEILRRYTGGDLSRTRILLHSDGLGNVDDSIQDILSEGVILDTVLFGQGGYLADKASSTGGKEYLASKDQGKIGLLGFYEETTLRFCKAANRDALIKRGQIIIPPGELTFNGRAYFDSTIGQNTKLVFSYNETISVSVSENLITSMSHVADLKTIIILVESEIDEFIDYTITKEDSRNVASIIVTITSSPIPGVAGIEINNKVNTRSVEFSTTSSLVSYIGIFQGLSPVLLLNVSIVIEDPTGTLTNIPHNDDGQGMDSVPNDGYYTGYLGAHGILGDLNQQYYGLTIEVSGNGVIPGQDGVSRKKRCIDCNSIGYVTRSITGGVIVIKNWHNVSDRTPPEKISDLVVQEYGKNGLLTVSWTAPGEDLNIGKVSGYEFGVGTDLLLKPMLILQPDSFSSNATAFLVEAGTYLQLPINTSVITSSILKFPVPANFTNFYLRLRTHDSSNNFANWSNPVSIFENGVSFNSNLSSTVSKGEPLDTTSQGFVETVQPTKKATYETKLVALAAALSITGILAVAAGVGLFISYFRALSLRQKNSLNNCDIDRSSVEVFNYSKIMARYLTSG
ncbi:calcium-activated chloride channel regulator 1-like [Watersipora subatra]|uniref:calcium-activated chloride channel regulator 1-like n=1 Tax=Watersipora subatra TaxID=2589382 RepID=UPI00355BF8F9